MTEGIQLPDESGEAAQRMVSSLPDTPDQISVRGDGLPAELLQVDPGITVNTIELGEPADPNNTIEL
jgi:hypothetical protein